ncbi:MAG: M48 family metalloprotease [Sphingomonadaceae bacterium]|nr:M48 family metalloprotease [Sphingomonadaceae bacterium]
MTFNPAEATAQYIDALGPAALAKAAAYTHGGHWIMLWGLVIAAIVTLIIVRLRLLERIAMRLSKRGWALRTWLIAATFFILYALLSLPWDIYSGWARETSYGRTSQPLADYLVQSAMATAIFAALGGLFFLGIYALIRRAGKKWWIWTGALAAMAISALMLAAPIFIEPLFNHYQPVPNGPVRDALVVMADEAHIPHDRIFMFDGSRQSNNFTANVSGVLGSARIAISDVAMGQASLDEVRAVTGHEIGHYVLGHVWRSIGVFALLAILLFFLADRLYPRVARLFGSETSIGDPVGLPILLFLLTILGTGALPIVNTLTRMSESEADAYSLRTVNLPDALSTALVKTAEYRYPRPGAVEEFIFYDHPSVERRVHAAMLWKAAHPATSVAHPPATHSTGNP